MTLPLKDADQLAARAARAATKEEDARDRALAMREYESGKLALAAKTARLRALRLAKEVGDTRIAKRK